MSVTRMPRVRLGDLWRHGVVVALVLGLAGAAAGSWWGADRERVAEATALVLVNPLEGNPFNPDAGGDRLVNLETEAQLVTSDAVGRLVATRTPLADGESVLDGVSVDVPANTQLLEITVTHVHPEVALARAQGFAETYLAYRRARSESAVFDRRAEVDERIQEHTQELAARAGDLDRARAGSAEAILLQQQITDLTTQMGLLRTQFASLQAASNDPGQVVTPATLAGVGLLGSRPAVSALGAGLGVALALAIVVARARRDTRVHDVADLDGVDVPVAGSLPPSDSVGTTAAVEQLRATVLATGRTRPFVVLVGGVPPGVPGESRVADELAAVLALAELEVVLVDLLGDDDPLGAEGDVPPRSGTTDVLVDRSTLDDELESAAPHLWLLAPGSAPERLDDLVAAPQMSTLVQDLRKRTDVVVLRAPELGSPRGWVLAQLADLVLVEAHLGHCRADDLERVTARVTETGRTFGGVVLVEAPRRGWPWARTGRVDAVG